ncbi:MAG: hypothetical protein AB1585_00925 [Thermodesulfobacteriota bacterium]
MTSLKGFVEKCLENPWKLQKNFAREVLEINEIAEKLVERIDLKIKSLKAVEAQADHKIALLDGLITKLKKMNVSGEALESTAEGSRKDVRSLAEKGFSSDQIARILDLPAGEVELILNLVH